MALLPPMSTKGLKFETPGTTHTGTLIEIGEEQQARKYSPTGDGGPDFWDDEKTRPKMQRKFVLQCQPDPAIAGDDGRRALYATVSAKPGGMYAVLNKALESANALGGQLTITFTGTDPESQNPANPRKLYTASYVEPTLGQQMQNTSSQPEATPAVAQQQAQPAQAAAAAPTGEPVKPDNFPQEVWDTLAAEARTAVLAQQ